MSEEELTIGAKSHLYFFFHESLSQILSICFILKCCIDADLGFKLRIITLFFLLILVYLVLIFIFLIALVEALI